MVYIGISESQAFAHDEEQGFQLYYIWWITDGGRYVDVMLLVPVS